MDIWTDSLLRPFLAITAHWIEETVKETSSGLQKQLKLRADLIGFQHLPGRHDGRHICQAFLLNLDHLGIADNVGVYLI